MLILVYKMPILCKLKRMKKIKIIHLISSLKVGGAEVLLVDLLRHLPADKFEHHVIYFYHGPHVRSLEKMGIKLYQIKGALWLYDPGFYLRLFSCIKKINPDIMHTSLWSANMLGRLIGKLLHIPVVSAMHLHANFEATDKEHRFRTLVDRYTSTWSSAIITVSDDIAKKFSAHYPWIPASKIHAVKNGIDRDLVLAAADQAGCTRDQLGLSHEHFVIGTVGRFIPRKNHCLLLESFAGVVSKHPNARLVLVGQGALEQELKACAARLNIDHVVIFVVGQSAYGYYPLLDCFVLSSSSEGLSIALLEAMCFGLPAVVSSDRSDHEVINSGTNGLVVPANDKRALGDALISLLEDGQMVDAMSTASLQAVNQDFSIGRMADSYANIFHDVAVESGEIGRKI